MRAPGQPRARGKHEAAAVAFRIADFLVRSEVERLTLFRQHLAATVRQASPLLIELAILEGIALTDALGLILPPEDWPWRPLPDHPPALYRQTMRDQKWGGSTVPSKNARFRRTFANSGLVIRDTDHPRGRFGIMPSGGVLGFTAAVGPALLSAFGASAMLKLPEGLPETLVVGLPGRQLGQVIDHPLFRDAGYRIVRVLIDPADERPIIVFRVPPVPFVMTDWPCAPIRHAGAR